MNKILVYADVDMNIIDGSSIWVSSIMEMLAKYENSKVTLLLKRPIERKILLEQLFSFPNIELESIWNKKNKFRTKEFLNAVKRKKLLSSEAAKIIEKMERTYNYDTIFIRGNDVIFELLKISNLGRKSIIYSTGIAKDQIAKFLQISRQVKYIACQTEELVSNYTNIGVSNNKLFILPPMIPDINESGINFCRHGYKLIYAGKFSAEYRSLEIIEGFNEIWKEIPRSELFLAGDKFMNKPFVKNFEEHMKAEISKNKNIKWYKAIPRRTVYDLISKSDLGISWRVESLNESKEISTKLLEYGSLGKPILLNRNSMHEKLLGADYPLFVNSKTEFIEKALQCFSFDKIYRTAAETVFHACKGFTMKNVYQSIKDKFITEERVYLNSTKKKIKILFAAHDFKFINGIIQYFENHPDFIVKIDKWLGHNKHNENQSRQLLNWTDVIVAEWCLGNAVWYSKNKRPHQKLFIRLHKQEITTHYPQLLNLKNVDKMIFIAPFIQQYMTEKINLPRSKSILIFNAVDVGKFQLEKIKEAVFHIGILGVCPLIKRLDKAITIVEKLKKIDDRYTLFIKSKLPQEYPWLWKKAEEREYYEKLFDHINKSPYRNSIIFEGWGDNVHEWFRKIGIILSTSDIEGSHQAVAEGMASGTIPIINGDWKGSEFIYPKEFITRDVDQAVRTITSYSGNHDLYSAKQKEVNQYCYEHFRTEKICDQWLRMVLE